MRLGFTFVAVILTVLLGFSNSSRAAAAPALSARVTLVCSGPSNGFASATGFIGTQPLSLRCDGSHRLASAEIALGGPDTSPTSYIIDWRVTLFVADPDDVTTTCHLAGRGTVALSTCGNPDTLGGPDTRAVFSMAPSWQLFGP